MDQPNGIRAYVSQDHAGFAVRIALVQVLEPQLTDAVADGHLVMPRPTHVLSVGAEPYARTWHEITDRLVEQDPTLTLSEEEARALYLALGRHFDPASTPDKQPVLVVHVGGHLDEEGVRELRKQIRRALADEVARADT